MAKNSRIVNDVFNKLTKGLDVWNKPVKTMELDPEGKRITVPLWQYELQKLPLGLSTQDISKLSPEEYAKAAQPKKGDIPQEAIKPQKIETPLKTQTPIETGKTTNIPSTPSKPPEDIVTDPVKLLTQKLKEAKPLRGQQEEIYKNARAQKYAKLMSARARKGGEKGYFAELGALKGEMPKVEYESIRQSLSQESVDELFNRINQANIGEWEKINAKTGLSKLLGTEGVGVPTRNELKLLRDVYGDEFTKTLLDKRPLLQKILSGFESVANLPKSIMATSDLSGPLRQGVFFVGRPKQWVPAFKNMLKSFASEGAYKQTMDEIASRPSYKLMRDNKLALTDLGSNLSTREEAFMSDLVEKIPGFGLGARASNRAYTSFLNKLRADVFDDMLQKGKDLGIADDPKFMKDMVSFVNAATGRGDLPKSGGR